MASLLTDARNLLDGAGFATSSPRPDSTYFHFEDVSVMGIVCELPSPADLVARWEQIQDHFLSSNASRFVRDANKAWNLYTVLLTAQAAPPELCPRFFSIEEDFRGTRKIAKAGMASREDVMAALAPLLPLRARPPLGISDVGQRLADRLAGVNVAFRDVTTTASPEAIAAALIGGE